MAYTTPSTQATGTLITSTMYKAHIIDNIKFLHGVPNARATRLAAQSITSGAWVAIQFDTVDWNVGNTIFSTTANTKFKIGTAGKYLVSFVSGCSPQTGSSAGTLRGIAIQKNTTTAGSNHEAESILNTTALAGAASGFRACCTTLVSLTSTQYVRGEMFQDSGGSINTSTGTVNGIPPRFSVLWVSS